MPEVLNVEKRDRFGTANARRLRKAGKTPAILYGHGKECVPLTIPTEQINSALRHGMKLVELKGGISDTAFLKEVQMDALGSTVHHVDLTRVEAGEKVEVAIAIELRGDAPGTKQGGVVEHGLHEVMISCPVMSIPEKIEVSINDLELDQSITAGDLQLPNGAELLVDPLAVVVSCSEPVVVMDEEEAAALSDAEPEIIGRKADDAGGDGE
jgi:large subunit ribosomal protein L25